jgi:tetratricopeptide (TPR) repeat protein
MKESKNNSSINIGALLKALSLHSSTSNSSTVTVQSLADEINESHDFGPFADRQLYEELAQVFLDCKERFLSQEDDISEDYDEDLDNSNHIRESSRSHSHMNTDQKASMGTWRASAPSLEMDEDDFEDQDISFQYFADGNDDVDEELKEDLENMHLRRQPAEADNSHFPNNLLNRFDSMGRTKNGSVEADDDAWVEVDGGDDANVDSSAHSSVRSSSEDAGNLHVTPPKPRRGDRDQDASAMDDFGSPCSFATARETLDTLDRKIERSLNPEQGKQQSQDGGGSKPQPRDQSTAETKGSEKTTTPSLPVLSSPPDGSDEDDSDLFSPDIPNARAAAASAETPLFSNVPTRSMSPVMNRAPLFASSAAHPRQPSYNSLSIPPPPKGEFFPSAYPSQASVPAAVFGSSMYSSQANVNPTPVPVLPVQNPHPPAPSAVPIPDPVSMPASSLSTGPLFKVDLSRKEKDKIKGRGSPRNKRLSKKPNIRKVTLPNLSVNTAKTNDAIPDPPLKTPVGFTSSIFMKSPEEMELDTPLPADTADENKNISNSVNVNMGGLNFNIGAGDKTPSRKSAYTWKSNRKPVRGISLATSPSAAQRSTSQRSQFPFSPPRSQAEKTAERALLELTQKVTIVREKAKILYTEKRYRDSVAAYTEAIMLYTNNFTCFPKPHKKPHESESLASMYGNRAAGLMMLGAFKAGENDCEQALKYLGDYNPVSLDLNNHKQVVSYLKADGSLTYMAKFLARMGRAQMKCGKIEQADQTFDQTARVAHAALACHEKIINHAATTGKKIPLDMQKISEKILKQCLTDAALNKSELSRVLDNLNFMQKQGGVRRDVNSSIAQKNNPHLLQYVNNVLQTCPSDERMQENMAICLASMKKWNDLIQFCERVACRNAEYDGVFVHDLFEQNPHKAVPPARFINQIGLKEAIEDGRVSLNVNQSTEAVLRLPSNFVKLYVRALRLEEKYKEGEAVLRSLDDYSHIAGPIWSPNRKSHKVRYHWLSVEKEKITKTFDEKSRGDNFYRGGMYVEALNSYAQVLLVDLDSNQMYGNVWETKTVGGRLNAVLFCNRAACLIALKKYEDATKECTAALKIEKGYMKAILRRARCYNRLERFEESIAEYKKWIHAVKEAMRNPRFRSSDECPFDRAADVTDTDFQKVLAELANVKERKNTAELKVQQAAADTKRRAQSTYNRRQQYKDFQNQRRWDSFGGSAPNRESKRSPFGNDNYGNDKKGYHESYNASFRFGGSTTNNQRQEKPKPKRSPSSNAVTCHYAVLQVPTNASQIDIKKGYRKMALKYHPDKNANCEKASDVFRKVQIAYETLSDEGTKRKYDVERLHPYC